MCRVMTGWSGVVLHILPAHVAGEVLLPPAVFKATPSAASTD
jgi:hypothetical protein